MLQINHLLLHQDHPRVCGKNLVHLQLQGSSPGSPPRVREKPSWEEKNDKGIGITPACAGKTISLATSLSLLWDHPRVCGKNSSSLISNSMRGGSPPRVREKHINPICPICERRDHPRVCGKNHCQRRQSEHKVGSPPRVREKPSALIFCSRSTGITPACAGKTIPI